MKSPSGNSLKLSLTFLFIFLIGNFALSQVCNIADIGNCSGTNCQYRYTTDGSSSNYQVVGIPFEIQLSDLPDSCYTGAGARMTIRGIGVNGPIYDVPSPMLFTVGTQPARVLNGATNCETTYENTNAFININGNSVNQQAPAQVRAIGANSACPVVTFDMASLVRMPSSQIGISNTGPLAAIQYRRWAVAVPPHCINTPLQAELIASGSNAADAQTAARVGPGVTIATYSTKTPLPPVTCSDSLVSATCNNDLSGMFTNGSVIGTSTTCTNGCALTAATNVRAGTATYYSDQNPVGTCASVSQVRTCAGGNNITTLGNLDGNVAYQYQSCVSGCGVIDGINMRNGDSHVFYTATSSFDCASKAENRSCANGAMDVIGTATNATCTPTALNGGDCGVTYTVGAASQVNDVTVVAGTSIIKPANWNIVSYGGTTLNAGRLYCALCTPGAISTTGCPAIANGQSTKTCAGDGMSWGSCVSTCNSSLTLSGAQPNITCSGAANCTWTLDGVSAREEKKTDLFAGFKKLQMLKSVISTEANACVAMPESCDILCDESAGASCGVEGATMNVACFRTNNCAGGCEALGTTARFTCHCAAPPAGVACNIFDSVNQPPSPVLANGNKSTIIAIPTTGEYSIPIHYDATWDDAPATRCMSARARVIKVADNAILAEESFPTAAESASSQCQSGGADSLLRDSRLTFNANAGDSVNIVLNYSYSTRAPVQASVSTGFVSTSSGTCPAAPAPGSCSYDYQQWTMGVPGATENTSLASNASRTLNNITISQVTSGNLVVTSGTCDGTGSCVVRCDPAPAAVTCGSAANSASASAPSTNLCSDGSTPAVSLWGSYNSAKYWTWNCGGNSCFSDTNLSWNYCFVAGTNVTMADGSKKEIEKIEVGEKVLTYDEVTKQIVVRPVSEAIHHEPRWTDLYSFEFSDGSKVTSNDEHRFYIADQEIYLPAAEIYRRFNLGQELHLLNSNREFVKILAIFKDHQFVPLFNLHVQGLYDHGGHDSDLYSKSNHNYFAENILAHNRKFCGGLSDATDIQDMASTCEGANDACNLGLNVMACKFGSNAEKAAFCSCMDAAYAASNTGCPDPSCAMPATISCSPETKVWGANCSAPIPATAENTTTAAIANTSPGFSGSAQFKCEPGASSFTVQPGATCNALRSCWRANCGGNFNRFFTHDVFIDALECKIQGEGDYCVGGTVTCTELINDINCP